MLRKMFAIVLIALIASACSSSRQAAVREASRLWFQDSRDSVKVEKVVVEVHDTVMEKTTIVVDRNEAGDTLNLSTVTERDRIRDRAQVKNQHERVVTKHDTVYIATRDSSYVQNTNFRDGTNQSGKTALHTTLKWVFWTIVAVGVVIIVVKIKF